jgi:hypothetical protein
MSFREDFKNELLGLLDVGETDEKMMEYFDWWYGDIFTELIIDSFDKFCEEQDEEIEL